MRGVEVPAAVEFRAQDGGRHGGLEGRLDVCPDIRGVHGVERGKGSQARVQGVLVPPARVGLDAHEDGEAIEDPRDAACGGLGQVLGGHERREVRGVLLVGAAFLHVVEEDAQPVGRGLVEQPDGQPLLLGGHAIGRDQQRVVEAAPAPARELLLRAGDGLLAQLDDGARDVELVLQLARQAQGGHGAIEVGDAGEDPERLVPQAGLGLRVGRARQAHDGRDPLAVLGRERLDGLAEPGHQLEGAGAGGLVPPEQREVRRGAACAGVCEELAVRAQALQVLLQGVSRGLGEILANSGKG